MSRVFSCQAAQLLGQAHRTVLVNPRKRSNLSAVRFCQSIGCSLMSFYQWMDLDGGLYLESVLTHMPQGTVKTIMQTALRRLRAKLRKGK